MKIFFLGCGVIGSLYAALFAKAGISVELYARGTRKNTGKRTFDSCFSGNGRRNEGKSGKSIVDTGSAS